MNQMIRGWFPVAITFLLVLGTVLTGCGPATPTLTPPPPTPTTAPPTPTPPLPTVSPEPAGEKGPIVIGAVFNATGWMASYDQPPRQAALLAIEDINAQGGVLGRPLQLIELDGKTDPTTVESAARQLIEQGAEVLIAPCDFDVGAPVSQVAQEMGMVGVSTCATSPLYGSLTLGDKQFTVGMWGNTMGAAMAEYGYKKLGWRTAYIIVETTLDYSLSLGRYFGEQFTSLGGQIVGQDTYLTGDQDFSAQIGRIKALPKKPDVLYISGVMPDIGLVVSQVRQAGIKTPIAGGDTYDDTSLFDLLGPEMGSDIYMATHSWLGPEAGWEMTRFMDLYQAEYGQPPVSSFIVMGWDTVQVLARAIGTTGTTEGDALAQAMEKIQFSLLSGNLRWTTSAEGHQPVKAAAIVQLQGGKPSFLNWILPESLPKP
jgi:branched-chain amino acid transport system substrate-binding protein